MTANQPTPPVTPANYASLGKAQQAAFWTSVFRTYPGTVTAQWVTENADLAPYKGDTALGLYNALAAKYPTASPQQIGSTVYQVWLGAGATQAIGDIATAGGAATGDAAQGAATGLPSWETAIGTFLGDLTSASTWVRAAKILIGGAMLLVGIAKLTGAGGVAARAVKLAPLL